MLDDNISHQLAVCVPFLIQAVHSVEFKVEGHDTSVICSSKYWVGTWMHCYWPNPVLKLADLTKFNTFFVPQSHLFVTASNNHIFTSWVERYGTRIKSKIFVSSDWLNGLTSRNRVERKLLIPTARNQQVVVRVKFLRAERKSPNRVSWLLNYSEFGSIFVS